MGTTTHAAEARGRGWAYAGAIIGGVISIAANVAHSFVPPRDVSPHWTPEPGAVISSAIWPILLFTAVEIMARVKWFPGLWWALLRFGGMLIVAAGAFIVSWRHMYSLLDSYGEDGLVSFLGPMAVDGLMVMATAALVVIGIRKNSAMGAVSTPAAAHSPLTPATTDGEPIPSPTAKAIPESLRSTARLAVTNHLSRYGEPPSPGQLAQVMNIPDVTAQQLLAELDPAPVLNGHITGGTP